MTTTFDTVIKGGTVVDGRNVPRRRADVGIKDKKITAVGNLRSADAESVFDASGLIVAPGFLDMHTHYDAQLFWDPYLTLSGWHGVTSVVLGNCGFGFAPARTDDREYLMRSLTRVEAIPYECIAETMPWTWESFPEWLDALDAQPMGVNTLAMVPMNPLMSYVMGVEDSKSRPPTKPEREQIVKLLQEGMNAGAAGWSAQNARPGSGTDFQRDFDGRSFPTDLLEDDSFAVLGAALAGYDRGFIQITCTDDDWERLAARVELLAASARRPVLWNAISSDHRFPDAHRRKIDWVRSCQERGLPVWGQLNTSGAAYFFTFEDWNMFDDSPAWRHATLGTPEERLAKFRDPAVRQAIKENPASADLGSLIILKPHAERFQPAKGTLLPDAARLLGYSDMTDLLLDLIVEDELKTSFQMPLMNSNSDAQAEVARAPYGIWGVSDGGAHTKFLTLGAYPTESIVDLTRERSIVTLEEAHWRLSALPAECVGLKGRGTITEGSAADLVVYDWENLEVLPEEVVYDLPGNEWRRIRRARGYRGVFVNGTPTVIDDEFTGATPGQLLRQV